MAWLNAIYQKKKRPQTYSKKNAIENTLCQYILSFHKVGYWGKKNTSKHDLLDVPAKDHAEITVNLSKSGYEDKHCMCDAFGKPTLCR